MSISRKIIIMVLSISVSAVANAQSRPRSSIQAGMGVIIHHYYHDNPYNQRYYGPAVTVGYDYPFAKQLSVSAWGSVGQILISGQTYSYEPSSPSIMKYGIHTGIVGNSERISFGVACNYRPFPWLSLGVGPYVELVKSAWPNMLQTCRSGPERDPETGEYITKEVVIVPTYDERQNIRSGMVLPIRIRFYGNDKLAVWLSYHVCFYRETQGIIRSGTNSATLSMAIYL